MQDVPKPLTREIALGLIRARQGYHLARNMGAAEPDVDPSEIALALANIGQYEAIHSFACAGLDHRVAYRLITLGNGEFVMRHFDDFSRIDHRTIARLLIAFGQVKTLLKHLEKFKGLDQRIAWLLVDHGEGDVVAEFVERFEGMAHAELIERLFAVGDERCIARNLDHLQGINHKALALRLIAAGRGLEVAASIEYFSQPDGEIAHALIDSGYGLYVAKRLNCFYDIVHRDIAERLFDLDMGHCVMHHIEQFDGLDGLEVALRVIDAGASVAVGQNLHKLNDADHWEILARMVARCDFYSASYWAPELKVDTSLAVSFIFAAGGGCALAYHLGRYEGLNRGIAKALRKAGYGERVRANRGAFRKGWLARLFP